MSSVSVALAWPSPPWPRLGEQGCRPPSGWQTGDVSRNGATVNLDDEVFDAVRVEAARSGRSEDQVVEAAVRRYIGPSVLDRLRERNRLVRTRRWRLRSRRWLHTARSAAAADAARGSRS